MQGRSAGKKCREGVHSRSVRKACREEVKGREEIVGVQSRSGKKELRVKASIEVKCRSAEQSSSFQFVSAEQLGPMAAILY